MIRTTVFCVFAVMYAGLFVLSAGTSVPASRTVPSTPAVPTSSAVPSAVHSSSAVLSAVHSSSAVPSAVHSSSAVLPAVHSSSAVPSAVHSPSAVLPAFHSSSAVPSAFHSSSAVPSPVDPSSVVPSSPGVPSSPVVRSSPVVHVSSNVATPTPSLPPVSSQILISSAGPVQTSHVVIVSASPTVLPVTETITIKNNKNETCLSALLDVTFIVKYESDVNINTTTLKEARVPLNGNMSNELGGSCNKSSAEFHLSWNEHGNPTPHHKFSMSFTNDNISRNWSVTTIKAMFYTSDSPPFLNATYSMVNAISHNSHIGAKDDVTYLCNSQDKIKMGNVTMVFKKLVLQPFSNETLKKDGTHCPGDEGSDDDDNTVPIAVGAALGGLVLIVLVAYIVGRRRSTRGYEQV